MTIEGDASPDKVAAFTCRIARHKDIEVVSSILQEAGQWLREIGQPLWPLDELSEEAIQPAVAAGEYRLFESEGTPAGTLRFQWEDPTFWPDIPSSESAFLHRIAIRRTFAGGGLSSFMIGWAVAQAREQGRDYLRVDCDARRPRLRAVYERLGFKLRDERQVGLFFVARYELEIPRARA